MKKIILGIFISLGFVFLMSYNSYAVGLNIPVNTLWGQFDSTWYFLSNDYGNSPLSGGCISGYGCFNVDAPRNTWVADFNTSNIRGIRFDLPNDLTLKPGDYIETSLIIRNSNNDDSLDFRFAPFRGSGLTGHGVSLLSMETERSTNNQSVVRLLFVVEGSTNWTGTKLVYLYSSRCSTCNIAWTGAPNIEVTGGVTNLYRKKSETNYSQDLQDLKNGVTNIGNKIDNMNKDVENKTEQNAQNAQNQGNDSSQSATNASSGLINAIGGFVGAITTASPSNCIINGNMGNFNMGNIDLCANPVPTFVQIIGSLVLIAICIPFAIIMFNRFIGLFRSFQG